jgi:hypothetical protein
MFRNRRRIQGLVALAVTTLFLAAAPAFALPSAHGWPELRPLELLALWWAELTEPLRPIATVFAPNGAEVDPNGQPTSTQSIADPTANPENGARIDPDG